MKRIGIAGLMLLLSIAAMAQTSNPKSGLKEAPEAGAIIIPPDLQDPNTAPREPIDSGVIVVPPDTDPGAVKKPPKNIDPGILVPPRKIPRQHIPKKKQSKDASCQGPAALCKQTSAR